MAQSITSISSFIEALGGDAEIAKQYGITKQAVNQWRLRQHIAAGFHLPLYAAAKRKGLNVCPSVFGYSPKDVEGLFDHKTSSLVNIELPQNVNHTIASNP